MYSYIKITRRNKKRSETVLLQRILYYQKIMKQATTQRRRMWWLFAQNDATKNFNNEAIADRRLVGVTTVMPVEWLKWFTGYQLSN